MTAQRCTCGYTQFSHRKHVTSRVVSRWARYATPYIASGASAAGSSDSSGEPALPYGRYEVPQYSGTLSRHCMSCGRLRRTFPLGGVTVLSGFRSGSFLYVLVADLRTQASSLAIRLTGPEDARFDLPIRVLREEIPGTSRDPLELVDTISGLPAGAVRVTQLVRARLPEITITGPYTVALYDTALEVVIPVPGFDLELEQEEGVQVLLPRDADLNGAPVPWLRSAAATTPVAAQPAMAPNETIPFDKWTSFIEYDARAGTLPVDQGWTYAGSGDVSDYALVPASGLLAETATDSYWTRAVSLSAHPSEIHSYMVALRKDLPTSGNGLELLALGTTSGTNRFGARLGMRQNEIRAVELSGTAGTALYEDYPLGWEAFGGSAGPERVAWYEERGRLVNFAPPLALASTGPEMLVRFGDLAGDGIEAVIRNVVCSVGGRYIRAGFAAMALGADPVLRFYFSREVRSTTSTTSYFKVRYTQALNPYAAESTVVQFAVAAPNPNQLVEVPVQLSGLAAKQPVRFSLERVCTNGYDTFPGTMHLHYVTMRSL